MHAEHAKGNVVDNIDLEEIRWSDNHSPGGDYASDVFMIRRCYAFFKSYKGNREQDSIRNI